MILLSVTHVIKCSYFTTFLNISQLSEQLYFLKKMYMYFKCYS